MTSHARSNRRLISLTLGLMALAAAPAPAWVASCSDLCEAAQAYQGYGTGAGDATCMVACEESNSACQQEWNSYFDCIDTGQPVAQCQGAFADARECSVCRFGEVGTFDGRSWNTADVLWVNGPACVPQQAPDGTLFNPLCRFQEGVQAAIDRQRAGLDTRVMVCPGVYREGYVEQTAVYVNAATSAGVTVESVVQEQAVVSGSEDWSGAWLPQTETVTSTVHNRLRYSTDLQHPAWTPYQVAAAVGSTLLPPTGFSSPATVFDVSPAIPATAGDALFFQQLIPLIDDRRVTFSVYIRPGTATRFTLQLLKSSDGVNVAGGAWYSFELPGGPCAETGNSSDAADFGIEAAGNDWYRVYLTQAFDHDPTSSGPAYGAFGARLHLVGPLNTSDTAEVMAPQLDDRPLDRFATTPRDYLATAATPASQTLTTGKALYVNDPAQHLWAHDWGLARHHTGWGDLPPVMRRSEMVFIDGQPLRPELSVADMEPGSFYLDDGIVYGGYTHQHDPDWVPGQCSFAAPCPIRIMPPAGVDMSKARIEVAVHPRLLWLNNLHDWEMRGVRFQHSTGAYDAAQQVGCPADPGACMYPLNTGAVALMNARRLTLLENRVDWNAASGLGIAGMGPTQVSDIALVRNTVNDNGISGEYFASAWGFSVDEEEFSGNNWRGLRAGVMGHATTGAKYSALAEGIIRGIVASGNHGHGLWFDYGNQAVTVLDGIFSSNRGTGIYFEANDAWSPEAADPTSFVVGCTVEDNTVGVRGISSSDVRLDENIIAGNRVAVSLIGTPRPETDHTKYLRDWYVTNNQISAECSHHTWLEYGDLQAAGDYVTEWQPVMQSLLSDYNTFVHPPGIEIHGFVVKGVELTFPAWQGCSLALDPWCFLPQDANSQLIP